MPFALLLIEKPLLVSVPTGVKKLPGNAWLIDLEQATPFLGKITKECVGAQIPHSVAYFAETPIFLEAISSSDREVSGE